MKKTLLTFMIFLISGVSLLPQDTSAKTYTVKKTSYVSPMYMYIGGKDHTFKLPNGLSIEQPKQCGRLSIKKGKNTTWIGKKGKCYPWGFAHFQFMYNKKQQLFIAIEPTSDKDDPITLMEFNKNGKLVGITEKNYYTSFKLKLPNYIQFEEYEPTYDLFLIKPKAKPVFVKHLKEKINRNEKSIYLD